MWGGACGCLGRPKNVGQVQAASGGYRKLSTDGFGEGNCGEELFGEEAVLARLVDDAHEAVLSRLGIRETLVEPPDNQGDLVSLIADAKQILRLFPP
jgi:hypothetical protein